MPESLRYRVCPHRPEAHLFSVELTITHPSPEQRVSLPAWIPGSYMIRDFAKNIVRLTAEDERGAIPLEKLDKQTWVCRGVQGPLNLCYEIYAWDLSVRSAHLDTTHGYFNGTSVFLRVEGQEDKPATVDILSPPDERYEKWKVATTLPRAGAETYGFGRYRAADYEDLIDHPVEMGTFTLLRFEAGGIPHEMALTGQHRADTERLCADLTRICESHMNLFGQVPVQRYLFQVMVVGNGYGGLEHRDSSSLMCSRSDLPSRGLDTVTEGYRTFLGLCSHEYFHTWNVKRIKPAAFQPYDLTREVHTGLLWAFEGITSYYDDLAVVRAGLISEQQYLEILGQNITRVLRTPGRFQQTVFESSFDAWTKFYKQDENSPNAIVSYYIKGALIALGLDLKIRAETEGRRSLDDVMRALWDRNGKTQVGVTEDGVEQLISDVSGLDLTEYFEQALRSTNDIPLESLFRPFGVDTKLRSAGSQSDKGGTSPREDAKLPASIGVRTSSDPIGARLVNVFEGGAAQLAGLAPGDVLIAIDGLRISQDNLDATLCTYSAGERMLVHAFRRDELMQFEVTASESPSDTCYLTLNPDAGSTAQQLRAGWLNR